MPTIHAKFISMQRVYYYDVEESGIYIYSLILFLVVETVYGSVHKISVLIASASIKGSGECAHMHGLTRALAAGMHKVWIKAQTKTWVKVFRIIPELRILRLTFHKKSASKC